MLLADALAFATLRHAALGLAASIATWVLYALFFHPLAKVPGPFWAKLSPVWLILAYADGEWHNTIVAAHERYGPVVRIHPNEVSFVDYDLVKRLYGLGPNAARKGHWYEAWIFKGMAPSVFATRDHHYHSATRRMTSHIYAMSSVLEVEPLLQDTMDLCWSIFRARADESNGEAILDMDFQTSAFTYDIVTELAMGGAMGFMKAGTDINDYMKRILFAFKQTSLFGYVPGKLWIFTNPVSKAILDALGVKSAFMEFIAWVNARVLERKSGKLPAKKRDLLEMFRDMRDAKGNLVGHAEHLVEAVNLLAAGADTTSVGIRAAFGWVLTDPQVYGRLQADLDTYIDDPANNVEDRRLTYRQCLEVPYLQACIKEGMRLHPSINFMLPREVPKGGVVSHGYYLAEGTVAGVNAWTANRDKTIYGNDADTYRPERWIENTEAAKLMESGIMTFSAGARVCLGKSLALVEINKWIAQAFAEFEFDLVNKASPCKLPSFESQVGRARDERLFATTIKGRVRSQWMAPQEDFFVRCRPRK